MKTISQTLLATTFLAAAGIAQAEVTANVAVVSDYLFRGINQTDGAAAQGGLDWGHESGAYAGTWISNVDFGGKEDSEVDLYAGFGSEIGDSGMSYDAGGLYYWYPGAGGNDQGGDLDYAEIYANFSVAMFTAGVAYTVWGEADNAPFDTGDIYYSLSADLPLQAGFGLNLFGGFYDFEEKSSDNQTASYLHYGASLSKDVGDFGALNVNLEQNDNDGDDGAQVWLGWSKEF